MNEIEKTKADMADMMAILADFEQAKDCAGLYISGRFNSEMRVKRALYESALISYRRALANGASRLPGSKGRKLWKFSGTVKAECISGYEKEADKIWEIANKIIAHRAIEEARIVEFPKLDNSGGDLIKTRYREYSGLMNPLHNISKKYCDFLMKEIIIKSSEINILM